MTNPIKSLGICLGASTISLCLVEAKTTVAGLQSRIIDHALYPHEGAPKRTLLRALESIDIASCDRIAATGRKFRTFVNLSSIPEPEAVEIAYPFVKPEGVDCPAVVSAGGETFMVYELDRSGRIANVVTGNKCASGTGEFFLQQLRRMNITLEEAAEFTTSAEPYHVSGRCSVFCKSDCTHATNKGIPRSEVTAGLCRMMANKILELLKKVDHHRIMITGGTARNQLMLHYLRQELPELVVPAQAPYMEALGAALWGLTHETAPYPGPARLFVEGKSAFAHLSPLHAFEPMVTFKSIERAEVQPGDVCLIGLDVGSTTTKAVLLRRRDQALLASVYLRTSGDPVNASRQCYRALLDQVEQRIDPGNLRIIGLGVTGSGRQIAGLHALSDGIINEIIAHATAAVHFDPQVDTIFEIGGQDAKYTYIINSVPSDYAMNEACSAGTGSFLEESAFETLGVAMEAIAEIALKGQFPPNFNDQCAAFIASDIKNAIHESVAHEDIVAGLVYSVCMNYCNRVKGNRPVGEKVFMQGGVCYNRAVPLAMAALVGKPIIVPPEPGLMGAFGVALEIEKRLDSGLMAEAAFDLETLAGREVRYGRSFTCRGGKSECDRHCAIAMIEVEGRKHPFGGACNRYYNLRHNVHVDAEKFDLVNLRQKLVFETFAHKANERSSASCGRVGLNRSFLVNTYYPLYSQFFAQLGFDIVLPEQSAPEGIDHRGAAFCYPVELAHGFFHALLERDDPPEFIFLPHFKAVPNLDSVSNPQSQVCPLVQGETYYLQTAFRQALDQLNRRGTRLLTPLLDLSAGLASARGPLVETARAMGIDKRTAQKAFEFAAQQQVACMDAMREEGRRVLAEIEADPDRIAVVLLSRPYNGCAEEAHMGIPNKFASRGVTVLPLDFLDLDQERSKRHMYWGMGKLLLKAARSIKQHPQLFSAFITNFSCGPDSFLIGYVREIMERKPSLTLELDSHTADAGIETRIEAFLDIIQAYRRLTATRRISTGKEDFTPAKLERKSGRTEVRTSSGAVLSLTDPRVTVLIPSMGRLGTEAFAAILRGYGLNAKPYRENDEEILKTGRANTSCKECLPLILTTGTLLGYIQNEQVPGEALIYFMPTGSGPCRFGQYSVFMEDLVRKMRIPDVAILALSSDNSYIGMGNNFERHAWWAMIVSDTMEDIRSMLLAAAQDPDSAMVIFEEQWQLVLAAMGSANFKTLTTQLARTADRLQTIPLRQPPHTIPTISLSGEIFVRRDGLSRQYLTERLAQHGFAVACAPVSEWIHYCNYLVEHGLNQDPISALEKLKFKVRVFFQGRYEKTIRSILARTGLVHSEGVDVELLLANARPYISADLSGEAVLTVGGALTDIVRHSCGVIAIGPFGCMPNRISEAILSETMTARNKMAINGTEPHLEAILTEIDNLPFLAIESDGSPFPQVITAKLETFMLRAGRLHERMMAINGH
ncbi:acyl-CoA dehydratase activase [Desulfobulbus alkaliphilus]|uniref:acyl-CoA dehydratase activase n=1 Tax=Desulfobulbus alkaliphilus TaxID=869814 RepID=UPI001965E6E3|nr:acyl-CoA dehydratase activase [Desulfobulbus alkaliphilus]MBM9535829.1 activase [Desulfobulbus alkaliphilus]